MLGLALIGVLIAWVIHDGVVQLKRIADAIPRANQRAQRSANDVSERVSTQSSMKERT